MGKLQVVAYMCKEQEWEHIRMLRSRLHHPCLTPFPAVEHGIYEGQRHCIRMYRNLAGNFFKGQLKSHFRPPTIY